jgi:hypothetical protein
MRVRHITFHMSNARVPFSEGVFSGSRPCVKVKRADIRSGSARALRPDANTHMMKYLGHLSSDRFGKPRLEAQSGQDEVRVRDGLCRSVW